MPNIVIESDGTPKGTKVSIDGTKISNLSEVSLWGYFDCYCGCSANSCNCTSLMFDYTTRKKDSKKDMIVRTRYTLDPAKASFVETDAGIDIKNPSSADFEKM